MKSYYEDDKRYDVHDCPFCGSKVTELYQIQVRCERCGSCGPEVSEEVWPQAIVLWNELPRKQGKELEELRSHWANLSRRIRRIEKKTKIEQDKYWREQEAPIRAQERANAKWAKDREAWLRAPIPGWLPESK